MGRLMTFGHAAAVAAVERWIASERPPHALLVVGAPGVGKATLGLDLAAGLLCLDPEPAARPCRACRACRKVEHGNHPDLHVLRPEGAGQQIRLGAIQALVADLALLPLEGRFRVAIVEQAQRLNHDAQNALLKTLEEPGPRVCLVLAADDSANLLPTLISRCARLRLAPLPPGQVAELLTATGATDPARGHALARLSGGRPGVALALAAQPDVALAHARLSRSLLDLLAADRRVRLAAVPGLLEDGVALAAASGAEPGEDEVPAKSAQRASPAQRRAAVGQLLTVWRELARDLALAGHGARAELRQPEMLDELAAAAASVDRAAVTRFMARVEGAAAALEAYANPELLLDVLLLEWPRSRTAA